MFLRLETELKPPRMLVPWVRDLFEQSLGLYFNHGFGKRSIHERVIFSKKDERFSAEWTFADRTSVMRSQPRSRLPMPSRGPHTRSPWKTMCKETFKFMEKNLLLCGVYTHIHECVILIANLVWGSQISRNHLVDSDMKLFIKCSQFVHRFWCILHSLRLAVERRGAACADKLVVL